MAVVTEPLLDVRDVTLSFAGVVALNDVSFHVDPRELMAIIGPNGAGKTSIFNCLNGVYQPQKGEIAYKGRNIIGEKPFRLATVAISRGPVPRSAPVAKAPDSDSIKAP